MNNEMDLTQQQFLKIVMKAYRKGRVSKNIDAKDLINEIKQQIVAVISSSRD